MGLWNRSPIQGFYITGSQPRALPWAGMVRPFGASDYVGHGVLEEFHGGVVEHAVLFEFAGAHAVLWDTQATTADGKFGINAGKFGFSITGTSGFVVVVEGCDDLVNPVWVPVGTNTLVGGGSFFSDARWVDRPSRVYRLRGE